MLPHPGRMGTRKLSIAVDQYKTKKTWHFVMLLEFRIQKHNRPFCWRTPQWNHPKENLDENPHNRPNVAPDIVGHPRKLHCGIRGRRAWAIPVWSTTRYVWWIVVRHRFSRRSVPRWGWWSDGEARTQDWQKSQPGNYWGYSGIHTFLEDICSCCRTFNFHLMIYYMFE